MPSLTLSYAELAARIGRSEIAARSLAQRKRWKRSPGNDGKVRVTIDEADLTEVAKGDRRSTDHSTDRPPVNGAGARVTDRPTDRPNPVHELQAKLAVAQALASERERELADLRADREAERQTLRGTVEALKQVLEAERLLRDELRRELDLARRPWWRRLVRAA